MFSVESFKYAGFMAEKRHFFVISWGNDGANLWVSQVYLVILEFITCLRILWKNSKSAWIASWSGCFRRQLHIILPSYIVLNRSAWIVILTGLMWNSLTSGHLLLLRTVNAVMTWILVVEKRSKCSWRSTWAILGSRTVLFLCLTIFTKQSVSVLPCALSELLLRLSVFQVTFSFHKL